MALDPATPPWLCSSCRLLFFVCELQAANRWRSATRDFGFGSALVDLRTRRETELATARARGTSALPEQLRLLSNTQLTTIQVRLQAARVSPVLTAFMDQLKAEISARGGSA